MRALLRASGAIDAINDRFGVIANWLVLIACLVSAGNAVVRYGLNALLALQHRFPSCLASKASSSPTATMPTLSSKRSGTCSPAWCCSARPTRSRSTNMSASTSSTASVSDRTRMLHRHLRTSSSSCCRSALVLVYFTWPWFLESYRTGEGSSNAGGLIRWPREAAAAGRLSLSCALQGCLGTRSKRCRGAAKPSCARCSMQIREAAPMSFDPRQHGAADVRRA